MKKKAAAQRTPVAKAQPNNLTTLITEVRDLIQTARRGVASVLDTFQVMTNFEIGRRIVEHEQKGEKRAGYGQEMLKALSTRLTEEFRRGFSVTNLQLMRKFFVEYESRIQQQPTVKFGPGEISRTPSANSATVGIQQQPTAKFHNPFTLSWTHYVELLPLKNPDERSFYEIEATNSGWSVPELRRQKVSSLYERLALSRDKAGIRKLATEGQVITKPEDSSKSHSSLNSWDWKIAPVTANPISSPRSLPTSKNS